LAVNVKITGEKLKFLRRVFLMVLCKLKFTKFDVAVYDKALKSF